MSVHRFRHCWIWSRSAPHVPWICASACYYYALPSKEGEGGGGRQPDPWSHGWRKEREIPALLLVVSVKLDERWVWCFCPEVKDTDCFLLLLSYSHAFAIASRVLVIKNTVHTTYNCAGEPCLVAPQNAKFFKILRHIKSLTHVRSIKYK